MNDLRRSVALVVATLIFAGGVARAEELLRFDPKSPPLPEPGKRYELILEPGKGAKPVSLIFVAGDETYGEEGGRAHTNIVELIQEGHGELPIVNNPGVTEVEIVDYDNDGYLDFKVLASWGTGGSWYNYYRYDGEKYVEWREPAALEINQIEPENALAVSRGRSGPSWSERYYHMKGASFILFKTEVFSEASYHQEIVPAEVPDNHYVLIEQKIENNRIIHRKITATNLWDEESKSRVVLDEAVNEAYKRPGEE
jgi:hypothetical protein